MHDDRIALADCLQVIAGLTTRDHEVFRGDLEPVDIGLVVEHVLKMVRSQPETKTEEWICHVIKSLQLTAGDNQPPAVIDQLRGFTTDILAGLRRHTDKTGALAGRMTGTGIVGRFAVIMPTADIDPGTMYQVGLGN